ncbi:MAG: SDR family oxidoreductase [Verrucomicrobia bacterium]|nr:SDR family oxidoreductase [Verrucomicrobiota bacterium]
MKKVFAVAAVTLSSFLVVRLMAYRDSFAGKVIVITGGSRGLGLALARRLARAQAKLAILARDQQELVRAKSDLAHFGSIVTTWVCDVKNEAAVRSTVEEIASALGGIDVLINNAGEIVVGPLDAMTPKDFQDALDIHFWAPFYMTFAALPHLSKSPLARIVNIASFGGKVAVPHLTPYCASKYALVGLSNSLRAELAPKNIFVTTVSPGLLRTGSHKNAFFKGQHHKEFTWFSLGASNPLISMGANRAARQILEAARRKRPELTITVAARVMVIAQAILPNLTSEIIRVVARLLPRMPSHADDKIYTGWESESTLSPSLLTRIADRATARYNGLRRYAPPQ